MDDGGDLRAMVSEELMANVRDLELELDWFSRVLDSRLASYFPGDGEMADTRASVLHIEPPNLVASDSHYAAFVRNPDIGPVERLAIILALIPHVRPRLLDVFFLKNTTFDRPFTEFGGETVDRAFLPTGQTLAFIVAADDLNVRLSALRFLTDRDHTLAKTGALALAGKRPNAGESSLDRRLVLSREYVTLFTSGEDWSPSFGAEFPAKRITTELTWHDLILDPRTEQQLEELRVWVRHGPELLREWGFSDRLRSGYRCLFYGPPGTGKTMTACLLGKVAQREVYKIDLSQVVSKYIGETEKNLSRLFDIAQHKSWILFFDEADALFGRRTQTRDSHDRYANQEVAYLLQRIEDYDGIAILASNMKGNIDPAFLRRFESVIHFPVPGPAQRHGLWKQGFSRRSKLSGVELAALAREHELTGASIMNIIRDSSLAALSKATDTITAQDIAASIEKEFRKEQRVQ